MAKVSKGGRPGAGKAAGGTVNKAKGKGAKGVKTKAKAEEWMSMDK